MLMLDSSLNLCFKHLRFGGGILNTLRTPTPNDPYVGAGEIRMLSEYLDYFRAVFRRKSEGLSSLALRQSLPPSTMHLAGMLKHLAFVEDYWFSYRFKGAEPVAPWNTAPWDDDPDWDWNSAIADRDAEIFELYDAAVETSRAIQQEVDSMDTVVFRPISGQETMNFRWVMLHMIEEYARHCGHADLLRESIDGQTGD